MKKEKVLSLLLAGLLTVSGTMTAFAQEPNSLDSSTYAVDTQAPQLHDYSINGTKVKQGESLRMLFNITDASEISDIEVWFCNEQNKNYIQGRNQSRYPEEAVIEISPDDDIGKYSLQSISITDIWGNKSTYTKDKPNEEIHELFKPLSFEVIENDKDFSLPELTGFRLFSNEVAAPGTVEGEIETKQNYILHGSTSSHGSATFINEDNGEKVFAQTYGNDNKVKIRINEYTAPGKYVLNSITLRNEWKHSVYSKNPENNEKPFPDTIKPEEIYVNVTNDNEHLSDKTPPVLKSLSLDTVKVDTSKKEQEIRVNYTAEDKESGVSGISLEFKNKKNDHTYSLESMYEGDVEVDVIRVPKYEPAGIFELEYISVRDKAGNQTVYYSPDSDWKPDNSKPIPEEFQLNFEVVNDEEESPVPEKDPDADIEFPVLKSLSLSNKDLVIPENGGEDTAILSVTASDNSGIRYYRANYVHESNVRERISSYSKSNDLKITAKNRTIDGKYLLDNVVIEDINGNIAIYSRNPESGELPFPDSVTLDNLSITVQNNYVHKNDRTPAKLLSVKVDPTSVTFSGKDKKVTALCEVDEQESGVKNIWMEFKNEKTNHCLWAESDSNNPLEVEFIIDQFTDAGKYRLTYVEIEDNTGNYIFYESKTEGDISPDHLLPENVEGCGFTVIKESELVPGASDLVPGASGNDFSKPSHNNPVIVNYESEKPNQNDKKAVEAYNFWQNVKNKIHKAEKGKTIKVFVPKEITNMPASVMETLCRENVGMTIKQNGKTITIPAGKAQPKQKLKAYWTFKTLDRLY